MIISLPLTLFFTTSSLIPRLPEVVTDDVSHGDVVFADTCSEDDRVHAVHLCDVSADVESYLVSEHLQRQQSSFVTVLCSSLEVSEVTGNAGDTQNAGLLVQDLVGNTRIEAFLFSDVT